MEQINIAQIISAILLFVITGLLSWGAIKFSKGFARIMNRLDITEWKASSINAGCEKIGGEEYKKARDEKWDIIVETENLKTKAR